LAFFYFFSKIFPSFLSFPLRFTLMSRGFASFLFFFLAAPLLLLALAWPSLSHSSDSPPSLLSLRRLELETDVDTIIRDELFAGARTTLPAATIQLRINQAIMNYLTLFPSAHSDSIEYSTGFSSLSQTNYLSLLSAPLRPPTLVELQSSSHVLILPLSQTQRYVEYSYTGGAFGTSILHMRLRARDSNTLFALPTGYHACVTSFQKEWPCVERE
jgi:hypothetical protein